MPLLPPQPWMTAPESRLVMTALGAARFVGGCVRDALLGLPVSDIDIASPHPPDEVTRRLEAVRVRVIPTGIKHGTVTAVTAGRHFEITTLRRDLACDGRHAEIAFTDDWREDAARRDFTINALSCTLEGEVFDPFDGIGDLAARRVRFIGRAEDRLREDLLRLLRHFRFYARYGGESPDPEALAACQALAPLLNGLSGERVRAELFRLLTGPRPAEVWALMVTAGLPPHLLPAATRVARLDTLLSLERHLSLEGPERAVVRLAALLDTDGAGVLAAAKRLRLSVAERARLVALVAPTVAVDPRDSPAALRRAAAALGDGARFLDLALLGAATTGSEAGWLDRITTVLDGWRSAPFPVSGADALALGVAPGPDLGRLLADVRDWWAEQNFSPDRAACTAELGRLVARRGKARRSPA